MPRLGRRNIDLHLRCQPGHIVKSAKPDREKGFMAWVAPKRGAGDGQALVQELEISFRPLILDAALRPVTWREKRKDSFDAGALRQAIRLHCKLATGHKAAHRGM